MLDGEASMPQEEHHSTAERARSTGSNLGCDLSRNTAQDMTAVEQGGKVSLITAVWFVLTNPLLHLRKAWLGMKLARLRVQNARLDRRLREHGIDPDAIPEIVELRRRYEQQRRQRDIEAE